MPVNHSFDATADSPAPIEIVGPSIEHVAIVGASILEPGRVVHANATASRIKQPAVERDTNTSAQGRVEIAVGFAKGIPERSWLRLEATAVKVHIANVKLRPSDKPMPLEIVSKLRPTVETRLAVPKLMMGNRVPIIEVGRFAMTELASRV